jgi:hypothetical protein
MEPEGSLPCSQQPATCSHPEARRIPFVPFQSHCSIILPSMTRSSKWCRLITLPYQNPVLSYASIRATCPADHCYHLVTSTVHEAPHYAALSSLPLLPVSPVQTPSSPLYTLRPLQALVSNSSVLTTSLHYSVRDLMPHRQDTDAEGSSLVMLIHIYHSTRRHTPQRRHIEVFRINKE